MLLRSYTRRVRRMPRHAKIVTTVIIVTLISGVWVSTDSQHCEKGDCAGQGSTKQVYQKPKKILYWTTFYFWADFKFGYGHQPFLDASCPVSNCIATSDKSEAGDADAIVYHMRNVDQNTHNPAKRFPHQRYVFFLMEHPHHQWNDLNKFGGFFNLTMTYRLDSDVPIPYGRILPVEHYPGVPSDRKPVNLKTKKKLVAWFVSNCNSHSKREEYVKELQKYLPVDVYGKCGNLKCPLNTNKQWDLHEEKQCYDMLEENYKFYLSFEGNYCDDYVTEKMFYILKYNVVPVVYGGTDYSRDAPPHSVINIEDYKSPKLLADYLRALDKDDDKYLKYFEWKQAHIVDNKSSFALGFCKLCEVLNDRQYPPKTYRDLDTWWGKTTKCNLNKMREMRRMGGW